MEKAVVLSCIPNGMPERVTDPNLRAGDIDLGRTFNAMREKQRKYRDLMHAYWSQQVNASKQTPNSQWMAAQAQGYGQSSGLGAYPSNILGNLYTTARQNKNVDELI